MLNLFKMRYFLILGAFGDRMGVFYSYELKTLAFGKITRF